MGEDKTKAHAVKCGAKTRSGEPCKNYAMENGRCRMHGGRSTGPKDRKKAAESKKKNKNAVTTGEHETIWLDALEEDEQALFTKINVDQVEQIDNEIRLTDIRIRRMLQRIKDLQQENLSISKKEEGIGSNGPINLETLESNLAKIQSIEEALTRVQGNKRQLIETKARISNNGSSTTEDKVADVMEGLLDAID